MAKKSGRPTAGNGGGRTTRRTTGGTVQREGAAQRTSGKKKLSKKQQMKKKRKRVILFGVEILALVLMLGILYGVTQGTKITKFNISEDDITINEEVKENENMKGYWNVALFGVDARDKSLGKGNRTDTIMIASINQDTGEVKLVSVFRDTYLNLGNDSYNKCNSAYARGGPELAINMLNMNLDLDITEYVTVGFTGVIDTIDALGGVEINVTEAEIRDLNNYQISMVGTTTDNIHFEANAGTDYIPVTQAGLQTLNGLQATAYCRIRYVGNDFKRAERQRTVLMAMAEKAKKADPVKLNNILSSVFPSIQTNLGIDRMAELLTQVGNYSVTQGDGFPFDDTRATGNIGGKGSCVVPTTLEANVTELHKYLFGDAAYEPSEQVKECSAKILSDTRAYVGSGPNTAAPQD